MKMSQISQNVRRLRRASHKQGGLNGRGVNGRYGLMMNFVSRTVVNGHIVGWAYSRTQIFLIEKLQNDRRILKILEILAFGWAYSRDYMPIDHCSSLTLYRIIIQIFK